MNEKFLQYLEEGMAGELAKIEELDEGRGRPKGSGKKEDKEEKEKGKRGRPKKEDNDDSGKEGVRDVTLTAKVKIGKETKTETKTLKDFEVSKLDDEMKKWEKALHKKFNYDADDITISKKIGDYKVDDEIDPFERKGSDGSDSEDDTYEFGRKDK